MVYWLESVWRDVRLACRSLGRRPGFSTVAILTLAVGLGTMTVAFSAVNAFFLRDRLVERAGLIVVDDGAPESDGASFRELEAFSRDVPALDVAAQLIVTLAHEGQDETETAWGLAVSDNYFDVLGVPAAEGRIFTADDDLAALVSDRFRRERMTAASLAATTLRLNGADVPVVGTLPADFQPGFYDAQVFVRFRDWDALRLAARLRAPDAPGLRLIARLRPGATAAAANHQLRLVAAELRRAWPAIYASRTPSFATSLDGLAEMRAAAAMALVALALISIVLVIAVFNVVGLLLARAVDRERELTLLGALGASRARLTQQIVVESLLLAAGGGAAALLVAAWSNTLLATLAQEAPMPQRLDVSPDATVVLFTAALVALSGAIAGFWPARRATRRDLAAVLTPSTVTAGRGVNRTRAVVVGIQTAGATLLFALAALLVRNAILTARADLGFEADRALVLEIDPASHGYSAAGAHRLVDDLRSRLLALPGVVAATTASRVPFYVGFPERVEVDAGLRPCVPGSCPTAGRYLVGPDYFRATGTAIRRGRDLDGHAQAVVVSETAARQFWPDDDPVGRSLRVGRERRVMEVVGIAADIVHRVVGERPEPYIYVPADEQSFAQPIAVVVRTAGDPRPLRPLVSEQVRALDRGLPIYRLRTMRERLEARQHGGVPIVVRFFGVLGALALFLSVIGLAGTVAYAVGQRAREFGIRAALGSRPSALARHVLAGALRTGVPGIVAGIAAAMLVTRLAGFVLRGVDLQSPLTLVIVGLTQTAVVVAAALMPARRAAAADPLTILRT
jgi:predicted permease